jgi:hypothetical protein
MLISSLSALCVDLTRVFRIAIVPCCCCAFMLRITKAGEMLVLGPKPGTSVLYYFSFKESASSASLLAGLASLISKDFAALLQGSGFGGSGCQCIRAG